MQNGRWTKIAGFVSVASVCISGCFDFDGYHRRSARGVTAGAAGVGARDGFESEGGAGAAAKTDAPAASGGSGASKGGAAGDTKTSAPGGRTTVSSEDGAAGRTKTMASPGGHAAASSDGGRGPSSDEQGASGPDVTSAGATTGGATSGGNGDGGDSGSPGGRPESECGAVAAGMVCIPQGTFSMGTNDADYINTGPAHPVHVAPFQLDLTEVTVAAYRECADAGYCGAVDLPSGQDETSPCAAALPDHDDYPVNCVSLFDAERYCAWRGKRLPSEQEWEYAAQRPGGRVFPWGNTELSALRLNACGRECDPNSMPWDDGFPASAPVGSFPAGQSFDGVLDLAGNVWEWTKSHNSSYPSDACSACDEGAPGCTSPCETSSGWPVARGGCAQSRGDFEFRVWERGVFSGYDQSPGIGFRCAK